MHMTTSVFPYLSQLLGGSFNQDWTLDHDSVDEAVAAFVASSSAVDAWATVADIRRFLLYNPDADEAYGRIFPNEITSPQPGMGAAVWLRWLERLIIQHLPPLPD